MSTVSASPRSAWLLLAVVGLAGAILVLLHARAERAYIAVLNDLGRRDATAPATPLQQVIPARYADAQMWVRHVLVQQETGVARLRHTPVDNAPAGRDVFWSSGFLWLLRGGAALHRTLTGHLGSFALERTLLWFNTVLLLAIAIGFAWWTARRAGPGAAAVVVAGLFGHNRFYEGFAPANIDHHGLINAALLGLLLGLVFMGAGWWRTGGGPGAWLPASRSAARRASVVAGISGGIGLGLSAASVIPVVAIAGLAGLAVAWWAGAAARREGADFDPSLWRIWGRAGAATSLFVYLLDYAPGHLGWRLEVNHPLYALAWWGGAELIAELAAWRLARVVPEAGIPPVRLRPGRLGAAVIAVSAAPPAILFGGPAVFLVADPFVAELRHFVAEGRSLPAFVRQMGIRPVLFDLACALLLVPAAVVVTRRPGAGRIAVGWLAFVNVALLGMTLLEVRWGRTASVAQIALLLVLATAAARDFRPRRHAWITAGAALLLLAPAVQRVVVARTENRQGRVAAGDLLQPLYRDLAANLRASQPEGEITLLASPNASAGIAYFGQFRSLGTLFWENAPGLRAAAEIFSAATDEEALRLLQARGVTHLAVLEQANFLGEYHRLLHPRAEPEEAKNTFGFRLLSSVSPPPWLQLLPYRPPADLREAVGRVRLFRVAPAQDPVAWRFHTAVAHAAAGEAALGEEVLVTGLDRVPSDRRADLLAAAGTAFYDFGADAGAARFLQQSLRHNFHPQVAVTAAWILATSRDPAVRDGFAALPLAERAARAAAADPTALSAVAAAHAELGRFPAAVAAAERALAAARGTGDQATMDALQLRLDAYRAGKPWRQ